MINYPFVKAREAAIQLLKGMITNTHFEQVMDIMFEQDEDREGTVNILKRNYNPNTHASLGPMKEYYLQKGIT